MKDHEEYMKLLYDIKELCAQLTHQFDDYSVHMNKFAENIVRYNIKTK